MDYLIVALTCMAASAMTFFSGFGLGTLILPVFAIFFTVDVAVALTAVVHFLNNLFKLFLVGKYVDKRIVLRFGFPAIGAAFLGAWLLVWLIDIPPLYEYEISNHTFYVTPIKLTVAVLIFVFAIYDVMSEVPSASFNQRYLPLGGLASGFFGGLSGHQGALRSAFLVGCNLSTATFIGTSAVIACLVDVARIAVYGSHYTAQGLNNSIALVATAALAAFIGTFIGSRFIKAVSITRVRDLVGGLLLILAFILGIGLIS